MKCPICNSRMKKTEETFKIGTISLGKFEAEKCTKCSEVYFTESSSDAIDKKAKQLGLWGLSARTKISYSGNSIIVRIPRDISKFMNLTKGAEITTHPEGKHRLVIGTCE